MQYLYACLFSNGHIKVGRSINPDARIATHADRVACVGIELIEYRTFPCAGNPVPAEADLIGHCTIHAEARHKNEWFTGLDFDTVCGWADTFSKVDYPASEFMGHPLQLAIDVAGSMTALATHLGITKAAVHQWGLPGRRVPAEYCPLIEKLTDGALICETIRPDVAWHVVRGMDAPEVQ